MHLLERIFMLSEMRKPCSVTIINYRQNESLIQKSSSILSMLKRLGCHAGYIAAELQTVYCIALYTKCIYLRYYPVHVWV